MTMHWTIEETAEVGRLVRLSGSITETDEFGKIDAQLGPGTLSLDLEEIEEINSCGVREWIRFMKRITQSGRPLVLVRCSPAIVRQLNMISNFTGGGTVRSVMLPYYCAECGHEERRLLEITDEKRVPTIEELLPCPHCGGTAEFDDLLNTYLGFAASGAG